METVALDVLWQREFQGHLTDRSPSKAAEPPQRPAVPPPPAQQIDIVLIGTMLEEGNSFATIADGSGRMDTQPVGAALQLSPAGMRVESVRSGSAVIRYQDVRYELRLQASPAIRSERASEANLNQGTPRFESLEEELDWLNSPSDGDAASPLESLNGQPITSDVVPADANQSTATSETKLPEGPQSP